VDISTSVRIGIVAVNLVIWTGLFIYLLRLGRKLRRLEEEAKREDRS
jgi:CcmD family protein